MTGVIKAVYYSNPSGSTAWVKFTALLFDPPSSLHVIARRKTGTSSYTSWLTQTLYSSVSSSTGSSSYVPLDSVEVSWYIKLSYGFTYDYQFSVATTDASTTPVSGFSYLYEHPGGAVADAKTYAQTPTDDYPYSGTAKISVSGLTPVAGGYWTLRVSGVTKATLTGDGSHTIELSYLFDNDTSASYTVELWPPNASTYVDSCTVPHQKNSAAETLVPPNITSLTITGVSSDGFTVTAEQGNLSYGSWAIQISRHSSFSTIAAESGYKAAGITSIIYEFSGLSANTLYYIRAVNYLNLEYAYSDDTWSQWTGIVPFDWAGTVAAGVVPSEVITKDKWDLLQEKISQVSVRNGSGSVSFAAVTQGGAITAAAFNAVRNELALLNSAGSVPGTKEKGDPMLAADFANSTASLKSAINRAISALNN